MSSATRWRSVRSTSSFRRISDDPSFGRVAYLYFGDGSGDWVELDKPIQHIYRRRWHYDALLGVKSDGVLVFSTFYIAEMWEPDSATKRQTREIRPPTTGIDALDDLLKSFPQRR